MQLVLLLCALIEGLVLLHSGSLTQLLHSCKFWQQKMAKDSAPGELCTKGAVLGATRICNSWENIGEADKDDVIPENVGTSQLEDSQ